MKVLVYGVGVIGSLTVHELMAAGNEVAVVARGHRREELEQNGLRIRMLSGGKEYIDRPRVLSAYDGQAYDVTFSIMQNQQQDALLETLAGIQRLILFWSATIWRAAGLECHALTAFPDHAA